MQIEPKKVEDVPIIKQDFGIKIETKEELPSVDIKRELGIKVEPKEELLGEDVKRELGIKVEPKEERDRWYFRVRSMKPDYEIRREKRLEKKVETFDEDTSEK